MKSYLACAIALAAGITALGQVRATLMLDASSTARKSGDALIARLTVSIAPDWHIASLTQPDGGPARTEIALSKGQFFKLSCPITGPKPHIEHSDAFGIDVETYEGTVVFGIPLEATAPIPPGTKLTVDFTYQACSEENCMMPTTDRVTAVIRATKEVGDKKGTQ